MNPAMEPALIAAAGGSAALGAIVLHERSRQRSQRESRVVRRLTFPLGVSGRQAAAALAGLTGSDHEFVLETRATSKGIEHLLHAPSDAVAAASHHLTAAMTGLRVEAASEDTRALAVSTLAMRVYLPALAVLSREDVETPSRAVLNQLAQLRDGEEVRVSFAFRSAPPRVPESAPQAAGERDHYRRLRSRAGEPTLAAVGLVRVRTATKARARELLDGIGHVFVARGVSGRPVRLSVDHSGRRLRALPQVSMRAAGLSIGELVGLVSWPLGDAPFAQVTLGATREMLARRGVAREGVPLFVGQDVTGERQIRLSAAAQKLHLFVSGPTGAGKSTLIARTSLAALARGQAGLLFDPKEGSLIEAFLERVSDADRDRVVVLSPANRDAPIGVDLFAEGGDADATAEAITAALRGIYGAQGAFGVRSESLIPLAIRSLAGLPNPNLLLVGRLFTDARLRQQAVALLDDPILQMAWAAYDDLSPEAQRAQVAAPLDRIMNLLQRPPVRATLAQPKPRLNLGELWDRGGWLLVDLGPGVVGEGAARLTGALLTWLALSTLEARASRPSAERIPTNLVFDELQTLSDLPTSVERLAERSRAFGGQLIMGTQTVSRLPGPLVDSIFGNVASLVVLRPGAAEAERLARELPGLSADDLRALPPFGVAARIATGTGAGIVTLTGRTEPLGPTKGNASYIRDRSARLYGVPRAELEAAITEQLRGPITGGPHPAPGLSRRQP